MQTQQGAAGWPELWGTASRGQHGLANGPGAPGQPCSQASPGPSASPDADGSPSSRLLCPVREDERKQTGKPALLPLERTFAEGDLRQETVPHPPAHLICWGGPTWELPCCLQASAWELGSVSTDSGQGLWGCWVPRAFLLVTPPQGPLT